MRTLALVGLGLAFFARPAAAQTWYCDPLRVYYPAAATCPVPWRPVSIAPAMPAPIAIPPSVSAPIIRDDGLDEWCSQVKLPSSVAICSDPDLRDLALKRQAAFSVARDRLSADQQKILLADQNSWVRTYPATCGLSNDPPVLPLPTGTKVCMARAGRDRISYLSAYGIAATETPASAPASLVTGLGTLAVSAPTAAEEHPIINAKTDSSPSGAQAVAAASQVDPNVALLFIVLVPIAVAAIAILVKRAKTRAAERYQEALNNRVAAIVNACVEQHMPALRLKRIQLRRPDHYGVVDQKKWIEDLSHFVNAVIAPAVESAGYDEYRLFVNSRIAIAQLIDIAIEQHSADTPNVSIFDAAGTPTDYEHFCAEQLRFVGWEARTTKGSGDQGTDIIAEKDNIRLVVQCKLYTSPVGNKAVQEISAARLHERANLAAVVTNNRYTPAAQQLAHTNNVMLLHHSELKDIDDIISGRTFHGQIAAG